MDRQLCVRHQQVSQGLPLTTNPQQRVGGQVFWRNFERATENGDARLGWENWDGRIHKEVHRSEAKVRVGRREESRECRGRVLIGGIEEDQHARRCVGKVLSNCRRALSDVIFGLLESVEHWHATIAGRTGHDEIKFAACI